MHGHAQIMMHGRSTSTSLEKGQSLMRICAYMYASMDPDFFYYGFARSGRTTLFEKWYGHGRTSRSGCYTPALVKVPGHTHDTVYMV